MKIIYLLPPSEGKNAGGNISTEKLSFYFEKPFDIAVHATEKDLKCTGKRYEEGIALNKFLLPHFSGKDEGENERSDYLEVTAKQKIEGVESGVIERDIVGKDLEVRASISRYFGVMYGAIDYENMGEPAQEYFNENFLILSGMYGILKPQDTIGNYKLPIETKGLRDFWGEKITEALKKIEADYIVDLLPNSYKKVVQWKKLDAKIVRIDFYETPPQSPSMRGKQAGASRGSIKKLTHGVKKVKGEFIKKLCESGYKSLEDFPGEKVQISENEYHISIIV